MISSKNVLEIGSGSTGATNVTRALGLKLGITVFCMDFCKGFIPILIFRQILDNDLVIALSASSIVFGHCWPIFLKFKGGKGIASYLGMLLGINLQLGVIAIITLCLITLITDYVAIGSIFLYVIIPIIFYYNYHSMIILSCTLILLLVGILFMVSAILSYQGKDFADFLYKGKSQKYIFMILGIFLIAAGITYGILVAKYKSDKYLKNAVRAVCFTLDDIKSVEDIDKYFDRRVDHDDPQPTITMQITTAFAIIYSFAGLILMAMGGSKGRRKYRRANQPIIIQMQAPAPAPSVEDETKSFVLAH